MIRKATPADIAAIAAFLEGRIETSMFLLGNLEAHGIDNTEHPNGTAYFLRETGDGITGVFGCTNSGFLMCQLPGLTATEAQTYAHLLQGYTLRGMTGDDAQVALILDALPVPAEAWRYNGTQVLYRLRLADLGVPDVTLRAPDDADLPLLQEWFAAYLIATSSGVPDAAPARAQAALTSGRTRLMIEDGTPVAMTGINAQAGSAVQVGGVYVPDDLRGQGRAGRAVAAHLAELRETGTTTAILFAMTPDAARAYVRIGFARIGDYRVAVPREAITLGPPT